MKRSQGKRVSGKEGGNARPQSQKGDVTYRVVKLKPARGPKPGQSLDAYLYGRDMGHKRDMATSRRQEGL